MGRATPARRSCPVKRGRTPPVRGRAGTPARARLRPALEGRTGAAKKLKLGNLVASGECEDRPFAHVYCFNNSVERVGENIEERLWLS